MADTVHPTAEMARVIGATAKGDLKRKQIELRVPHKAWDPRDGKFRMAVGTGLWDPGAATYLQPSTGAATASTPGGAEPVNGAALFNVGFRFDEPKPMAALAMSDAPAFVVMIRITLRNETCLPL